jgi:hypothetical protein
MVSSHGQRALVQRFLLSSAQSSSAKRKLEVIGDIRLHESHFGLMIEWNSWRGTNSCPAEHCTAFCSFSGRQLLGTIKAARGHSIQFLGARPIASSLTRNVYKYFSRVY